MRSKQTTHSLSTTKTSPSGICMFARTDSGGGADATAGPPEVMAIAGTATAITSGAEACTSHSSGQRWNSPSPVSVCTGSFFEASEGSRCKGGGCTYSDAC